jgi:acyl dehydratase
MGLFFEDFEVGQSVVTPGRTVTEADVVAYAGLSGDFNPIHVDESFAQQSIYGSRIAHGLIGVAFTSGLLARLGLFDGTSIAFLSLEWQFRLPIRIGDTIRVRQTVRSARRTSDGKRGVLSFDIEVLNQLDEVAQSGARTLLVACSPATATPDEA